MSNKYHTIKKENDQTSFQFSGNSEGCSICGSIYHLSYYLACGFPNRLSNFIRQSIKNINNHIIVTSFSRFQYFTLLYRPRALVHKDNPQTRLENNRWRRKDRKISTKNNKAKDSIEEARNKKRENRMIVLFSYQLGTTFLRNTQPLIEIIKDNPGWFQCFDRTWLISTRDDIKTLNQKIREHLRETDLWLLIEITSNYQGWLPKEVWEWIEDAKSKGY